jgi:hypothetical protein
MNFRANIGWIDNIQIGNRYISGWVNGGTPNVPVEVVIYVNGNEVGQALANEYKEGPFRLKMSPDGMCGFRLELPEVINLEHGDVVRVKSRKVEIPITHSVQHVGMPCSPIFSENLANALIVGHSHIGCMENVYGSLDNFALDANFIQLHHHQVENAPGLLNESAIEKTKQWLTAFEGKNSTPVLVISPWGNEHNALGLINHPKLFDFVHPECPDLLLNEKASLIPYEALLELMNARLSHAFQIASRLSEFFVVKRYWIEAPPPIACEDYILKYPHNFIEAINKSGVSPASLRYKTWLLRATAIRKWCREHGWGYISVPDIAKDSQGFLSEKAWPYFDAVHGNAWFGKVMLEEILATILREVT